MAKDKKKSKKLKEKKSKHKKYESSSSSSTSEDEWVEKKDNEEKNVENQRMERDEWMNLTSLAGLYSNRDQRRENDEAKRKEKEASQYNPKTNVRELNPYWKHGGDGLPSSSKTLQFMKPSDDDDSTRYSSKSSRFSNWRKKSPGWRDDGRSWKSRQDDDRNWNRRDDDGRNREDDNRSSRDDTRNWKRRDDDRNRRDDRRDERRNWKRREDDGRNQKRDERSRDDDRNSKDDNKNSRSNKNHDSSNSDSNSPKVTIKDKFQTSEIIYESKGVFRASDKIESTEPGSSEMLTDKEMNDIAAKIVKAEILGNAERVNELKQKLDRARELRDSNPKSQADDEVLLTRTDSKGFSRPVNEPSYDQYDGKRKKKPVNTHDAGKRLKYYPDDDKHSLQNMFENEKFGSSNKEDEEFIKAVSKVSKSDDLDDMFMDSIRKKDSDSKSIQKERDRAIREHQRISQSLDNCKNCIQSSEMLKHLMVSLGETVYLSLPPYEPITDGHCLLIPIRHVPCSTQLDENEWTEILDFRKSLTKMFKSDGKTVIFYETAVNINSYPHMFIHCVPLPEEQGDLAPIYFKKGIDECETEWSTNKKLINMSGKDVRRSVPKGLPYFWVSFGMKEGFAHVIEEQKYFPKFFAEEIIGGILDLHHSKWRKSFPQKFDQQKSRVLQFTNNWTKYDCTNKH